MPEEDSPKGLRVICALSGRSGVGTNRRYRPRILWPSGPTGHCAGGRKFGLWTKPIRMGVRWSIRPTPDNVS